ncbi:hypothetical protein BDV19DRAFT_365078 [Aspergillus venezuelensis]
MVFSMDEGGHNVSAALDNMMGFSCPDQNFSKTHEVTDYKTVKDWCPILTDSSPDPAPCALKFNQSLVDEMDAGRGSNCSSQDWDKFRSTCKTGNGTGMINALRGVGVLRMIALGVSSFLALL